MKLTHFKVDVSSEVGQPLWGKSLPASESLRDPLFARGLIIDDGHSRHVFCAIDYCALGGLFYHEWRKRIARAAGTKPHLIALHCVHQHQAPFIRDLNLMESLGSTSTPSYGVKKDEMIWWNKVSDALENAVRSSLSFFKIIDSIGSGQTKMTQLAANRRILDKNGKLKWTRWSVCNDRTTVQKPIGKIDPWLQSLTFWGSDQQLLASMNFYASHPQSGGRSTAISAEAPGEMLKKIEKHFPQANHLYFTGCQGDVTFGKYSTQNPDRNYKIFGNRLAQGAIKAIDQSQKNREILKTISVKIVPIDYKFKLQKGIQNWKKKVVNPTVDEHSKVELLVLAGAQKNIKFFKQLSVSCWQFNKFKMVSLPGEPFVEYQIAIKKQFPKESIAFAALGDYTPGYLPTEKAFHEGGYELDPRSCFTPKSIEKKLKKAIYKSIDFKK